MVIEVSKELDVRRIGIDRYSLKTGLNLRTAMDMSFQVLKEPRGFIRVIQAVMAIVAFSTTVGFSTDCKFSIPCEDPVNDIEIEYEVDYPFVGPTITVQTKCGDPMKMIDFHLPYDFSNGAEAFVATGVLSFLYCIIILVLYICFHQAYAQNNKIPVIDLGISTVLSIFWLASSSAWAQGVSDLKHYLHPESMFKILESCADEHRKHDCQTLEDGSYGTLNASLVLGFANFLLWVSSLWFVYKETVFFAEPVPETNQNQQSKVAGRV